MPLRQSKRETFFFIYSIILLMTILIGFSSHAIINSRDLPPPSGIVIIHAMIMLGWFGLLVVQTGLVRMNKISTHRNIGLASMILSAGVLISGILIMYHGYRRTGDALVILVNTTNLVCFTVLYLVAFLERHSPADHKRLMIFASLAMMAPAFGRICHALDIHEMYALFMWIASVLVVITYDLLTLKKLKRVTFFGSGLLAIGMLFIVRYAHTEVWESFLHWLLDFQ